MTGVLPERVLAVFVALVALAGIAGCAGPLRPSPWIAGWFGGAPDSAYALGEQRSHRDQERNLTAELDLAEPPLQLAKTKRLKADFIVANRSHRPVHLEFPTAQRFDVLILDQAGQPVTRWSEDRVFEEGIHYLTINPGERLRYEAALPTRELAAGQPYVVEGFLADHENIRARKPLVPEK